MNTSCCLEVGWHLYGEDYHRGEFMVNMRQALAEENIAESAELPDHISHCLRLLPHLEDKDAQAFAQNYLSPAIKKVLAGLDQNNPYKNIIELLQNELERFGSENN